MIKILILSLIFFSFFGMVEAPSHLGTGFSPQPEDIRTSEVGCPEGQITTGDPNIPCRLPMIQELFLLPAPILMVLMIIAILVIVGAVLLIRRRGK